jgi:hypothetical protein
MVRQRLEPDAEAARGVVGERPHFLGSFEQNVLRHVLGVGFLQTPVAASLLIG